MILQGRQLRRHLVTDDFSKLHCIHSNDLEKSTGTSGSWIGTQKKSSSIAKLLLVPVLAMVKLKVSKKQSRPNLWGWRHERADTLQGWAVWNWTAGNLCLVFIGIPGPDASCLPKEDPIFLTAMPMVLGCSCCAVATGLVNLEHCIACCWEDHHQQKQAQNITKCLLPAPCWCLCRTEQGGSHGAFSYGLLSVRGEQYMKTQMRCCSSTSTVQPQAAVARSGGSSPISHRV